MRKVSQPSQEGTTKLPTKHVKGFKFRIYPTEEQKILFAKTFGCCRYVWNRALHEAMEEYKHYLALKDTNPSNTLPKPILSGFEFCSRLTSYKQDPNCLWLNEVSAVSLQQTMLHLGTAFSRFFKERIGYPNSKKRTNRQSFTMMTTGFRFKEGKLYIAKSNEPLEVLWSRELPSDPTSCTISMTPSGDYDISFVCEYFPKQTHGTGIIGIDLGLTDLVVTSEGTKIPNPKYTKQYENKLARLQRVHARKHKGSNNKDKARIKVAQQYQKIVNSRNDHLHKLSRILADENQVIGLEKLVVSNMVKNPKLSKSINDASWSTLTSQIQYKAVESQNCKIVYMDCWYPSSHICHVDQYRLEHKLSLKDRSWTCPQCGTTHDRDINAAINIRNEAILTIELNGANRPGHITLIADRPH